jgi:hypothetical protein
MERKRKLKLKNKLPAKQRKLLVKDIQQEGHVDVAKEALEVLSVDEQFSYYPQQLTFITSMKEYLHNLAVVMIETYKDLLDMFCKGKKFLQLQNSWFLHVNIYFDMSLTIDGISRERAKELHEAWDIVLKKAEECSCNIPVDDQRIILVSLSRIVGDLMTVKIKEKKKEEEPLVQNTTNLQESEYFNESTISLFRYSGFALHSMMVNRNRKPATSSKSTENDIEIKILEAMSCKLHELASIPSQIKELDSKNFHIISPKMIPFVQQLVHEVMLNINDQKLQVQGHRLIEVAKAELTKNNELVQSFQTCIYDVQKDCSSSFDESHLETIRKEFTNKITNARINEYFNAKKELDLEIKKKVVDADQSLRDKLKTLSTLKSRF